MKQTANPRNKQSYTQNAARCPNSLEDILRHFLCCSGHVRKACKSTGPRLTAQADTLTLLGTYAVDSASKKAVGIVIDELYYPVVVLGVGVVQATALHHFPLHNRKLHGFETDT